MKTAIDLSGEVAHNGFELVRRLALGEQRAERVDDAFDTGELVLFVDLLQHHLVSLHQLQMLALKTVKQCSP